MILVSSPADQAGRSFPPGLAPPCPPAVRPGGVAAPPGGSAAGWAGAQVRWRGAPTAGVTERGAG
jgi:hypothetical protein